MLTHAWVIPALLTFAAALTLAVGRRLPHRGVEIGVTATTLAGALTALLTAQWLRSDGVTVIAARSWFTFGTSPVHVGTQVDGLSVVVLLVVGVVALAVQVFSAGYMREDRRTTHYVAALTLFTAAMQTFVLAHTTLQMIFGWEIMALCSFLLIGHWWEEQPNVQAALKAFLTTRVSDVGLFVGVSVLFFAAGRTFELAVVNDIALAGTLDDGLALAAACALLVAVIGKSAQFPLHTWLPDAMAGPTPVSALIHAATMVVAGVYLIARLFPLFATAFAIPPLGSASVNPVAVVGAITIVIAGLLAFVQHDIKKALSYSTISQLGYLVLALGVGAWTAAVFHLFTHAFFKALLFLCAGSVGHAVHGFDMEKDMGGLRRAMPITHATFAVGAAALIGVPPLAGFWSKEQIATVAGATGYPFFQAVAFFGTLLTAGYTIRIYRLVFAGAHRGSGHPRESPAVLTAPLVVLAVLAAVAGFAQAPLLGIELFDHAVTPDYLLPSGLPVPWETEAHGADLGRVLTEVFVVALGIGITLAVVRLGSGQRSVAARSRPAALLYRFLANRYYLDALYEGVIVRPIRHTFARLVHAFDHRVLDGIVDALAHAVVRMGQGVDVVDRRIVDGVVGGSAAMAEQTGGLLRRVQNGRVQRYAVLMLLAVTVVAVVAVTSGGAT